MSKNRNRFFSLAIHLREKHGGLALRANRYHADNAADDNRDKEADNGVDNSADNNADNSAGNSAD